jgi:ribosome-binding factor A
MSWDRIQRQEAILREKIAVIILDRLNDPRMGFVTVTGVKLSRDKRHCKVMFTVLGTEAEVRRTERALKDAAPRVQQLLAATYKARTLPEILFVYDGTVEKESRLRDLIESLDVTPDAAPGEGDGEGDGDGAAAVDRAVGAGDETATHGDGEDLVDGDAGEPAPHAPTDEPERGPEA